MKYKLILLLLVALLTAGLLPVSAQDIDCEIDVWVFNEDYFLGHDEPQYQVDYHFLCKKGLWIHCKNLDALDYLPISSNYFWHEEDSYTLTSKKFIWTYPEKKVGNNCVSLWYGVAPSLPLKIPTSWYNRIIGKRILWGDVDP